MSNADKDGSVEPCSFTVPAILKDHDVRWEGECASGKAHGHGVLRAYPTANADDPSVLAYFGMLYEGVPTLGVIETAEGYLAGEFVDGELRPTEDRNVFIRAFAEASAAATAVSQRFEKTGNVDSAKFYAERAKRLRAQMD